MAKAADAGAVRRNSADARLYFLDNLRSFTVLLVIVYHAAIAYMVRGPQWYYVVDTQSSFFFNVFVMVNDVFIMPVMFFIAGYFALISLVRKGQQAFWRDKMVKVAVPWLVGIVLVAPAINYLFFVSRYDDPPGYLYFWSNIFFGLARQHAHYWFLGVLLLFFLLLAVAYKVYPQLAAVKEYPVKPSVGLLAVFGLVTSVAFWAAHQFFDDQAWVMLAHLFMLQPGRCVIYACYFALGVYAYRQRWFSAGGYRPEPGLWLMASVALGWAYSQYRIMFWQQRKLPLVMAGNDLLFSCFCLAAVVALLALFQRRFDFTSRLASRLAANSYAIYFIHQPVLLLLILAIRGYEINVFIKYLAATSLAMLICFVVSEFGLTKLAPFAPSGTRTDDKGNSMSIKEEL